MQITRTSSFTGVTRTLDLDVTQAQLDAYDIGALIQHAFTNISAAEREFIKTGMTTEEWDNMFSEQLDSI